MKFGICTTLSCDPCTTVDLPVSSWDAIQGWYVKWDTLHYTLDGEKWHEVDLNNDSADAVYWKRPTAVRVYDPETYETIAEDV
jgi:hypothetical protein